MEVRQRRVDQLGVSTEPCGVCGSANVVAMRSRAVRRGAAWVNPRFDPAPRTYDLCRDYGAERRTENDMRI